MFNTLCLLLTLTLGACILGEETGSSPYEEVFFEAAHPVGVADGLTPISLTVYGVPDSTLTLRAQSARFLAGSEASPNEKTILLVDNEGLGSAHVQLVSTTPGLATLSLKLAPLTTPVELEFLPVQLKLETPVPLALRPGQVSHQLCVRSNTERGQLEFKATTGLLVPDRVDLQGSDSASCKGASPDWPGLAMVEWTPSADDEIELRYFGSEQDPLLTKSVHPQRVAFPGYEVIDRSSERNEEWTAVHVRLSYRDAEGLPSTMATAVTLDDLRSVPAGFELVGSSSGNRGTTPTTDDSGWVTLYIETQDVTTSLFATPTGGGTLFLGEIPASEPPPVVSLLVPSTLPSRLVRSE